MDERKKNKANEKRNMGKVKRVKDGKLNVQGLEKEGRGAPATHGAEIQSSVHM